MLVNCCAYQNGKRIADIKKEQIGEYVRRPDCFVWVALYEPEQSEIDEMALQFDLHPLYYSAAHDKLKHAFVLVE